MQTIGDYDDDSSAHTLFGLIRKIIECCTSIKSDTEALISQVNSFETSMLGRVDSLETSMNTKMEQYHNDEMTAISTIYRVSASNAFSASQVKSTKAAAVSPKQVLLKWNCTQDNDCTISSSSSDALSNWTDIKKFNVYYGTTANAAKMTYYGTVNKNDSKLFYQNYEYTVSGLEPNTTYYFWVTSVMSDGMELEDSSAVRTVTTPTLASAQAKNLKYEIKSGTSLKLTWEGDYSGYVTYKIYYSTSSFTATSSTTAKATTSSQSYTLTGLATGTQYYLAVCAVVDNGSVWVGNTSSGASNYLQGTTKDDFSAHTWSEIHDLLQSNKGASLGWELGDKKDGWIIIGINSNELKLWRKQSILSYETAWSQARGSSIYYYSTFNTETGVDGLAYSSALLTLSDVQSGYFTSGEVDSYGVPNNRKGIAYWLNDAYGPESHYLVSNTGYILDFGNDSNLYTCPYVMIH